MTRSQVAELMFTLVAAFPRPPVGEKTLEVYETLLVDLDHAAATRAVDRLIRNQTWLPSVAEIRRETLTVSRGPRRSGAEAWGVVMMAIRQVGREREPQWKDPLIGQAIRMWGSWRVLCDSPEYDPGGRARFIDLYDELAGRKQADEVSGIALPAGKTAASLPLHENKREP